MTAQRARSIYVAAVIGTLFNATVSFAEVTTVRIRLETTDVEGNLISAIGLGDDFLVKAFVQDLRDSSVAGVFASYMDLTYPATLASLTGGIAYENPYENGRTGNISAAGLVDEVGAFGGFSPPGSEEHLLFTLPFSANAIGSAVFASDPADTFGSEVLLHGLNNAVPLERIDYGIATLSIVAEDCVENGSLNLSNLDCACVAGHAAEFGFLVGDVDGDGNVAFGDFLVLSGNFGKSDADYSTGDLDCSGTVDFADFLLLSENFGKTGAHDGGRP